MNEFLSEVSRRLRDNLLDPGLNMLLALVVWAGSSMLLLAPGLLFEKLLPKGLLGAWMIGAFVLGFLVTWALLGPPVVQSWKVREGSRMISKERKGAYRT